MKTTVRMADSHCVAGSPLEGVLAEISPKKDKRLTLRTNAAAYSERS